jgi:hypothetical protein
MDKKVYEFISKQTNDPIVERRTCERTGEDFPIFQADIEMLEKLSPVIAGKKYLLPLPKLAPEARQQLRYMFINYYHLYRTTCWLTGKSIISRFPPESEVKVFTNEAWAGDSRDYTDYAVDYAWGDVLLPIHKLIHTTPYQDLIWSFSNLEHNAQYTNYTADVANCYFLFDSNTTENSCYCTKAHNCSKVFDCLNIVDSQECYDCVDVKWVYNCTHCYDCSDCNNCAYLIDCHGCNYCLFSTNLQQKQYYIFNAPVSKEEYESAYKELQKNNYNPVTWWDQIQKKSIRKNIHLLHSEHSIGENIRFSNNAFCSTNTMNSHNMRYCDAMESSQDCLDVDSYGHESFLMYNATQVGRYSHHIWCSSIIGKGENLLYCIETKKSKNCFGCVNIKEKEYCIFNKQYSKDEYETIVPQLIQQMQHDAQWGEFFPTDFSILPYNDSAAYDYYPIKEILSSGKVQPINPHGIWCVEILAPEKFISDAILHLWSTDLKIKRRTGIKEVDIPDRIKLLSSSDLPASIDEVHDDLLQQAIVCEVSGRPFRIVQLELDFYRRHHLPLPRKHPDIRREERIQQRPGKTLYLRNCDTCKIEMLSVYKERETFKVFCEACYNKEIYW